MNHSDRLVTPGSQKGALYLKKKATLVGALSFSTFHTSHIYDTELFFFSAHISYFAEATLR